VPKVASLAIVVALLAVGGFAPGPAVAAKAKRCRVPSHHAKLLAKSRQLLVYRDFRLEQPYIFCVRPNGRRVDLLSLDEFGPVMRLVGEIRLAGRYAAFRYRWLQPCPTGPPCTPSQGFRVAINRPEDALRVPVEADVGENDTTFGLTAGGVLAWLTAVPGGQELRVLGRTRFSAGLVVDSGAIDPASFSVQGTTLSWTNTGTPKTFSLSGASKAPAS
jgi:hypothetical protein